MASHDESEVSRGYPAKDSDFGVCKTQRRGSAMFQT